MSKAIGELMKTSCLKCGKSEGSNLLVEWRDLFEPITQRSNLSNPNCSRVTPFSDFVRGALRLNLNYSSFSSFNYYIY